MSDGFVVGVDVGGSSIEAVVTDPEHRVAAHALEPTDASSGEAIVATTVAAIHGALARAAGAAEVVTGIGIGVPGRVDVEDGTVRFAMNLRIGEAGLALGPSVAEAFGLEVAVENDVRAAAVGADALFRRRTPDLHTLVYLNIGTGISAGVVVDGRLQRGRLGLADEIGHVVVTEDGPDCRCGLRGCLEAVAAGPAIARMWPSEDGRSAEALFRAAAAGHPDAVAGASTLTALWTEATQWLALAHGADLVVLGGGVGSVGGPILGAIRDRLAAFAERSELARRLIPPDRVTAVPPDHPAGAIGAAVVARNRLTEHERGVRRGGAETEEAMTREGKRAIGTNGEGTRDRKEGRDA
jgi:predicted NBD/HSP70 family sugar kinase